jgi:primosomal protein N' (replication factor Y)
MTLYADVVLPLPVDQTFTYAVPRNDEDKLAAGMRVLVPFGGRTLTGFVVGTRKRKQRGNLKLKSVIEMLDESPVFSPALLAFTRTLSRHFFSSWGEVLQAALPPSFVLKSRALVFLTPEGEEAMEKGALSGEEKEVAARLRQKPLVRRMLEKKLQPGTFAPVLARLEKKGYVSIRQELRRVRRKKSIESRIKPAQLELDFSFDERLRRAGEALAAAVAGGTFSPFLLCGSGTRREAIYFDLIRKTRAAGGRVLYLVPEISLTSALLGKLGKKLGEGAAVLHSGMTEKRRESDWRRIKDGRAGVVVGSRMALFSPLEKMRLIIADEEQDESYSQQENASYDIRTGAWLRARQERAALVYGSAAPTVETYYKAKKGRFLIDVGSEPTPAAVTLVDSRSDPGILCRALKLRLKEKLTARDPVLLFFNRRGYAAYLACARCGFVPRCARCDLALAYHKREGKLVCHYCRYSVPPPEKCPRCGGRLIVRKGVGIEAVAEELRKNFPHGRVEIFAADEAAGKGTRTGLIREFAGGEIDFLVGTELLAHQSGIPPVSFVAILHPEMRLALADFRSGQKTFQAITRALAFLRADGKAEALIQTEAPDHFSIRAAAGGDYRAFYSQEIRFRRLMEYPPFSFLAEVHFLGENVRKVAEKSREFAARLKNSGEDLRIFGPSRPSVARIRGLNRVQVSLKARRRETLTRVLAPALKGINLKKSVVLFG